MSLSSDSSLSPPLPPSHEFHFPVLAIALIAIVATGVLLISYYIFVIKCCLHLHRVDVFNRLFSSRRRSNLDTDTTSASATPSPGLDEAVIRSIPVIKFRKSSVTRKSSSDDNSNSKSNNNEAEIECAVCLCEFEEGEKLRVIPNCCHAFHIDCIDIWLQNSSNCPLCRTGISASSMLYNPDVLKNYRGKNNNSKSSNSSSSRSGNYDNFSGDEDDYLVIEIQGNNLDEPKLIDRTNSLRQNEEKFDEMTKKLGRVCSIGDELIDSMRTKDEEFRVQPVRRSMSMDLSINRDFCVEMQEYCRSSNIDIEVNRGINCDSSSSNSSSKVRKSIFSFGYGRSSKGSVQPTSLDI